MLFTLTKLAAHNLVGHWRHSMATLLSMAVAFVALALFEGFIGQSIKLCLDTFERRNMLGQLMILPESKDDDPKAVFSAADQDKIKNALSKAPSLAVAVPFLAVSGTASNGKTSTIFVGFGYDIAAGIAMRQDIWAWNTTAGLPLAAADEGRAVMVIGQGLGSILGCKPTEKHLFIVGVGGYEPEARPFRCTTPILRLNASTAKGRANAVTAEVGGLVDGAFRDIDMRYVMMPLNLAQDLRGQPDVSFYSVQAKPGVEPTQLAEQLRTQLEAEHQKAVVKPWSHHRFGDYYNKTVDFMAIFRNFIVLVIVLIAGLSVFSAAVKSVDERIREAGTFRSLGYMPGQITAVFLLEQFMLLTVGALLGGLSAWLISSGLNSLRVLYEVGVLSEPVAFYIALTGAFCYAVLP